MVGVSCPGKGAAADESVTLYQHNLHCTRIQFIEGQMDPWNDEAVKKIYEDQTVRV